ncbi:MAG: SH3 domain-containing protein [Lachnospiraceae bacterium]|nr:SH3 domain-containing protein [Lachnospiraceae bacterium]
MDVNFQKYLRKKTLFHRRRNRFNIKQVVYLCAILFVLILLLNFIRGIFSGASNKKSSNNSSKNESVIKHEDEYYYNLVDKYISEINDSKIDNILNSYNNLGIIKCNGYINFRSEPNEKNTRSIIGLMNNGDALDILEWDVKNNSIYCKVKSGGMTGYVAKQFVMTGDVAKEEAKKNAAVRAIVLVDKLRMRSEPNTESDNVVGTTYKGERYKLISLEDDWAKVQADNLEDVQTAYISADSKYIEIKYCLSEARTQDLKSDVLNYYDNIGVSTARDYINVRKTAKSNGTIIGKLPGKAGCEILGESGDFYKIKSGKVTGYVTKKYLATGKRAEDLALQYADLRAIIKIAALKVRNGPGTKYKQWTTIRREETYIVTNQLDGWVEIEIDEDSDKGYISTSNNYVEVRYALEQAVEFFPATKGPTTLRTNIKNTAIKYIGGRYVWGGTSLGSGVDCSGFVQQIFKIYGVKLPRTSRDQAKVGTAVSSGNKKVGDLIFYANSSGVIDHVAIYIGNNQIVHAANSKSGIKINNWDYRTPHSIRNVLGSK